MLSQLSICWIARLAKLKFKYKCTLEGNSAGLFGDTLFGELNVQFRIDKSNFKRKASSSGNDTVFIQGNSSLAVRYDNIF